VANKMLDAVAGRTTYTAETAVYVKLHIGDPGAAGTANAATETTRKAVTFGSAASGGAISNTAALTWTSISGSQDATHFSAWTDVSAGTFLFSGTVTANSYTAGDTFEIAIGDLDVTLTNIAA
jgi:uncharacterized membrane protein YgdD (TMEM256/DUF423 family)